MRAVRLCLGLVLAAMVVAVWQRREPVIEAYTEDRAPVQFEFDGLDLEIGSRAMLGPSPLLVPPAPDTKSIVLALLPETSSTVSDTLPAGTVSFGGTVVDEFGPVPLATVRVEHHRVTSVDGSLVVTALDVVADENGYWELANVGGGRWRVRAFVPDKLASSTPTVRFVSAGESVQLDLVVARANPALVLSVVSPPSRYLDESTTVAVTAGRRRVDAEGIVVIDPEPGARVEAVLGGSVLRPVSALTAVTDGSGVARFGFSCSAVGATQATFRVTAAVASVDEAETTVETTTPVSAALTECVLPPPPPEEIDPESTSAIPGQDGVDG